MTLGDKVRIIKVDVDANPELSSMLKVRCWMDGNVTCALCCMPPRAL